MNPILAALQTEDFGVVCYAIASAEGWRSILSRREEVLALREAYQKNSLTEKEVREFVDELMKKHFQKGYHFPYEEILSAIAVALEPVSDAFTDEYINDLAALQIAEMPYATRVARVCQKQRSQPK